MDNNKSSSNNNQNENSLIFSDKKSEKSRSRTKKKPTIKYFPSIISYNDKTIDLFIRELSINSIKALRDALKEKYLDHHYNEIRKKERITPPKLKKEELTTAMMKIFVDDRDYKEVEVMQFLSLFEKIANRFCEKKYVVGLGTECFSRTLYNNTEHFFLDHVNNKSDVNLYEILTALTCFIRTTTKEKLEFIFEMSDTDDDGLVSKAHVIKMINTINNLFCNEITPINLNSHLMHQSMGNYNALQMCKLIFDDPGKLNEAFMKDELVSFDKFFEEVQKIENYESIFPFSLQLSTCLNTVIGENVMEICPRTLTDFSTITTDLFKDIKTGARKKPNSLAKFKTTLEPFKIEKKRKRKIFSLEGLDKSPKKSPNRSPRKSLVGKNRQSLFPLRSTNQEIENPEPQQTAGRSTIRMKSNFLNKMIDNKSNFLNYVDKKVGKRFYQIDNRKINDTEVYPFVLKKVDNLDNNSEVNDTITSNSNKSSFISRIMPETVRKKRCNTVQGENKYLTNKEIIDHIDYLLNLEKNDLQTNEILIQYRKKIEEKARKYKDKIQDSNVIFPRFDPQLLKFKNNYANKHKKMFCKTESSKNA